MPTSTLDRLASEAIRQGASPIEIEHKDGYEEVYFMKGGAGSGITLPSPSPEVRSLLRELHGIAKRGHRVGVDGFEYDLRVRIWDSFGEDAFRVSLRRLRSRSFSWCDLHCRQRSSSTSSATINRPSTR